MDETATPISIRVNDITGQIFNNIVVTGFAGTDGINSHWWCRCYCGVVFTAVGARLKNGEKRSCGCLYMATRITAGTKNRTHGRSRTKEYCCWVGMKKRCSNPKNKDYPRYGGRGIVVCDRWKSSFENFFADMGYRPTPSHTIERLDIDKGYEPSNCRWATPQQQARNQSNNRQITHNGQTRLLIEWSELTGIASTTLWQRIKRGWDISKALTTPVTRRSELVHQPRANS